MAPSTLLAIPLILFLYKTHGNQLAFKPVGSLPAQLSFLNSDENISVASATTNTATNVLVGLLDADVLSSSPASATPPEASTVGSPLTVERNSTTTTTATIVKLRHSFRHRSRQHQRERLKAKDHGHRVLSQSRNSKKGVKIFGDRRKGHGKVMGDGQRGSSAAEDARNTHPTSYRMIDGSMMIGELGIVAESSEEKEAKIEEGSPLFSENFLDQLSLDVNISSTFGRTDSDSDVSDHTPTGRGIRDDSTSVSAQATHSARVDRSSGSTALIRAVGVTASTSSSSAIPSPSSSSATSSSASSLSALRSWSKASTATKMEETVRKSLRIRAMADGKEEMLYRRLLDPEWYEKDVRPTLHHSLPTNVTFGFLLNQIVELDERNQVLTTRSWLNVNWLDPRLTWNSSEWDGIKTMYVPYQRLWKPDIILVNNAVRQYYDAIVSTDIMTTSDGNVTWLFSAIFKSSCQIKVRYYPFDDQECELKFASWSHELEELDLKLITDKGDLSSYMNNSEFDLLEMTATREIVKFPTNELLAWPVIVIRIRMHRRPLFYVFNHILPCVLISSMAVLGFFMPPETGEKINMCITTMLSMGVYLQSITESIPPTSEAVPLIGMYYVASLFMVCLATCINVITLNVHRNGAANQGRRVPWWMEKYVLGYMASTMRMSIHEPDSIALLKTSQEKRSTIRRSSILRDLKKVKNSDHRRGVSEDGSEARECECIASPTSVLNIGIDPEMWNGSEGNGYRLNVRRSNESGENAFLGRVVREQLLPRIATSRPQMLAEFEERFRLMLKRIYRSLQQHEIREEILDERKRIMWQWQQLATVVDRFLLVLFFLATLSTIAFFLVLPVTFRSADGQPLFL